LRQVGVDPQGQAKGLSMKVVGFALAGALLVSSAFGQATWYVDGTATPPGNGSAGQPFTTITAGIQSAGSGDTVVVAPGTYREALQFSLKPLTLRSSQGPEVTTVEYPDGVASWMLSAQNSTIEGFRFDGRHLGEAKPVALLSSTVRQCVFERFTHASGTNGFGRIALFVNQGFVDIQRCTFANNYLAIDFSYGVARVRDCVFESNTGWDLPPEFDPDWPVYLGHTVNGSIWESGPAKVQGTENFVGDARLWETNRRDYYPSHFSRARNSATGAWPLDPDGTLAERGALPFDPAYAPAARVYCTAKLNSDGCASRITTSGGSAASASSSAPFTITATDLPTGKKGLFFYGFGPRSASPFQGGFLCVAAPTRRTPVVPQAPATGPCAGSLSLDFNAFLQSGADSSLVPGQMVRGQWWHRDPTEPAGFGTVTTDAIEFGIGS
jgi:hypothetical protein